jgi:hypothetical protein
LAQQSAETLPTVTDSQSGLGDLRERGAGEPQTAVPTLRLSSAIPLNLKLWFGRWPLSKTGTGEWLAFNLRYLGQLLYTLALVLPVGLLVAACAFVSAAILFRLQRGGQATLATTLETALDAVPYILWMLPALSLAYWLWDAELAIRCPYWLYLMVILLGFGAFPMPFFIHANLKRLRMLERTGVLDGERVTGGSDLRILARIWRFEMRRPFVYQALYCTLFVMLLEFSAFGIVKFDQQLQRYTIFTQGNIYDESAKDARRKAGGDRDLSFAEGVRVLLAELPPGDDRPWARHLPGRPELALDPAVDAALRDYLAANADRLAPDLYDRLRAALDLRDADQRALFFDGVAGFYFRWNTALVLGLFAALLIGFDLPAYAEDGHG